MKRIHALVFVLVTITVLMSACGDSTQLRPISEDDIRGILWNTRDAVFDAEMGHGPDGELGISDEWYALPGYDDIRYIYYGNEALGWIPALRNGGIVYVTVHLERDKSEEDGWKYTDWAWVGDNASGEFKDEYPWITTIPEQNIADAFVLIVPDIQSDITAFAGEQGIDPIEIQNISLVTMKLRDIALIKLEDEQGSYILKYQYESGGWKRIGFKKAQ